MPTIASDDYAIHGVQLQPDTEVVVEFDDAPTSVEVVVSTPGTAPIFWCATGLAATVNGARCRLIPANYVASDSATPQPTGNNPYSPRAVVRLITAGTATVSVQRGS